MLETIGESTVRMTTRTDNNLAVENRDTALKQAERQVVERPIETSQESAQTELNNEEKDAKSGSYNVDDDGIFFEKYDKDGNVIFRVPPEQKPIDERA
jgi:hypothetical protein